MLVCIGAEDPIIPPEQRAAFEKRDEGAPASTGGCSFMAAPATVSPIRRPIRAACRGFFYHEATDRRSWNAMIELFNETLK